MFLFDQLTAEIEFNAIGARIDLALIGAGVFDIGADLKPGTRVAHERPKQLIPDPEAQKQVQDRRAADIAAGKAVGRFTTQSDIEDAIGEANLKLLSGGAPRQPQASREMYRRRATAIDASLESLRSLLIETRTQYYPNYDIADFRHGPNDYISEIQNRVDLAFPPKKTTDVIEKGETQARDAYSWRGVTTRPYRGGELRSIRVVDD